MVGSLSVPPPRFARGTVLLARHSPRLEFLCKAVCFIAPIQVATVDGELCLQKTNSHLPSIDVARSAGVKYKVRTEPVELTPRRKPYLQPGQPLVQFLNLTPVSYTHLTLPTSDLV